MNNPISPPLSEETEEQKFQRRNVFRRMLRNYGNACFHDSMDEADEYEAEILMVFDSLKLPTAPQSDT